MTFCGVVGAAPPTLSRLQPPGGQRGTKVAVTCVGSFAWPVKVWAPGVEVTVRKESGELELAIPADLAADRIWLRLYNSEGASAAAPFLIGSLPEVSEQEPNNAPKQAEKLPPTGATINGTLQARDVDGFVADLRAGQTVVAAVDAHTRLGSPMDAVLQVASPDGIILAENHDDVGLDPRLAYTAAKSGLHIVRLFAFPSNPDTDIAFHGGADYVYRLTITTGPYITHTLPLAAPLDKPGEVEVRGWNIPQGAKLPVAPWGGARLADHQEFDPLGELRVSPDDRVGIVVGPDYAGSARIRLTADAVVPGVAQASSQDPFRLTLPNVVTGQLASPRQLDVFRLPLTKGERLVAAVEGRSLNFPIDPVLQLVSPAGAVVADIDDIGQSRDAALSYTPPQDGDFLIKVRDRHRAGGDRFCYRLTVRQELPDFELSLASDTIVASPGKPAELPITVVRRGSVGSIKVEAVGLPSGLTAAAAVSEPSGPTAGKVTVSLIANGAAFSGPICILGTTSVKSGARPARMLRRLARTPAKLGATFDTIWITAVAKP
jgi:hypothetical protein